VSSPAELAFGRAREESRLRLLLIEDDPNDAELVQACLAEAALSGAEIVHVATLAEGLRALELQAFHVTVLDLDLPDSSGFDTLDKLGAAARSPIIVVTGHPHPELETEAFKRRAYEVLPKSELDARSLMRVVRRVSLHGRAERRYRALIDSSREAIGLFDSRGELVYGNPAMHRMLWGEANLIGLAHPADREPVQSQYAGLAAMRDGRLSLKAHFRHHDGSWRMLEVALHNRLQDGDVAAVVASFTDINSQVDLEQRFRATFDQAAVGIAHVAEDGGFQLVNRKLCQILGYTREELSALSVFDVSHPEDRDVTLALRRKMRAHEIDSFSVIKRYLRKDGGSVWAEVTVSLVRTAEGAPRYEIALFEDISARRQAEDALQRSERRFRALIENSSDGILLTDGEGRMTYGSPGARRILGYAQGETLGWQIADMVHPQDQAAFGRMAASVAARPGVTHVLRARVCHKSGRYRLLEGTCTDLRAEESVRAMLYNFRDVTEREEALARAGRVSLMYAALSAANEVSAQLKDERELYQRICEIAVQFGGMRLASVRLLDAETNWLETCGCAGDAATYLGGARISVDPALPEGRGLAGPAMRENRTLVCNDFVAEPRLAPWHDGARRFGFAAVACVPLRRAGAAVGLLILYSAETDYFDAELVTLVERMTANAGHALDRIDAERRMRESEARFRSLANLSSDWYWEQDEELRFTWASPGAAERGAPVNATMGKRRWEIPEYTPLSGSWTEHRTTLEARKPFRDLEYVRTGPEGERRYIAINGEPMFHEDGRFKGYRGTARDITERKLAELGMERLKTMYAALSSANEAILRASSRQELLTRACEIAVAAGNFVLGTAFMLEPDSGLLKRVAASGSATAFALSDTVSPGSLVGLAWQSGEVVISNDYQNDPRTAQRRMRGRPYEVGSGAVWPLYVDAEPVGLFSLLHAEKGAFSEQMNLLLQRLAENISFALVNFTHEERRLKAEQELRESEERFRNLTELSSDWYWEQDEELRLTRLYGGIFTRLGIDPQALLGKRRWDLAGVDTGNAEWKAHREVLARRESFRDFEYPMRLSGGDWLYVSVSGHAVFDEAGVFRGYRGTGRDITARRRAEEQLRRFRVALNASAESIFLVDADALQIIDVNDAAARLLGYERDAIIGANPVMLFEGRDEADLRAEYERLTAGPDAAQFFRAHFRRRDGTLVPVEGSRRLLRASGRNYVVGIARDITERLKAEERLQQSLERFQIVARATNDVVWDWNLVTDQLWWNDNFCTVFGYDAAEVGAYVDAWTTRIHPEDAARVKQDIKSAIERGDRVWTAEYRFRRKDGSYANVLDRGLPLRDGAGRPVRMIGAMVDITERKRAERKMALHAQRQEIIARLGQFALGGADLEQVLAEAARVLRAGGCDVAAIVERVGGRGYEFLVRAARGEDAEASVGKSKVLPAHSKWATMLDSAASAVEHDRKYFEARDTDRPWSFWLRRLGSGVYVPIRSETGPFGILMMGSLRDAAFDAEDLSFAEAIAHVLSTAVRRHHTQTRLAYMAEFDTLTGLPNRNQLQDRLNQSVAQARRRHWHGAVLFIDLDRFKLINDTLGHHVGDRLIAEVGQRLKRCVRGGDTVGRVSGDEFGVVLTDLAQADDAAIVAQKILDGLARPFDLGGNEAYVTASIGISVFPADGSDAETLLKNADMAMYRAKELTRNAYCFFTAEMNQRSVAKLQLNTDLRRAIERGEFVLYYQPKLDLRDARIHGVEALLRWNHPQRGLVSPLEFIPALEDSGLILPVGEWVLGEAARQLAAWQRDGLELVPVAVNLSAKQFRRRDLDALIRGVLAVTGVPAGLIELEITESCLMDEPEEAVRLLANLRAAGLKISVDDFGTGYSSLSYLTRLPLTALKIDRSFVRDVATSAEAASIVRAVIDMAHNLGFTVIAEGVETEEQVAFLRRHGCDLGQGFLFDRPMPAHELAGRLRRAA
jgi:diguanylate cyclase (GGDEF)-like protein/PAS domain S-box-containing protein